VDAVLWLGQAEELNETTARIPDVSEIREQFAAAGTKLLVSVEQLAHGESQ